MEVTESLILLISVCQNVAAIVPLQSSDSIVRPCSTENSLIHKESVSLFRVNCSQELLTFSFDVYNALDTKKLAIVKSKTVYDEYTLPIHQNILFTEYEFDESTNCTEHYNFIPQIYPQSSDLDVLLLIGSVVDPADISVFKCMLQETEDILLIKTKWIVISTISNMPDQILLRSEFGILPNLAVIVPEQNDNAECNPRLFTKIEHPSGPFFEGISRQTLSTGVVFPNLKYKMNGRQLVVSTLLNHKAGTPNMELLQEISRYLNFTYTLLEPKGHAFGAEVNGSWTGMIGQLTRREASFIFAYLSENEERQKVVDFIYPAIRSAETGVIYKKENYLGNSWLLYGRPLQGVVYFCILIACISISLLLMILSILSSTKNEDQHKIKFIDLLFFTSSCIFLEGGHIYFKTQSKMVLWAFWWLFCVIMGAVYTSMLTKALIPKNIKPFNTAKQLGERSDWKYGALDQSWYTDMFQRSNNNDIQMLWNNIQNMYAADPSVLSTDFNVHIDKVLKGKYAFINSVGKIITNCNLEFLKFSIIPFSQHSLAVPKGSILKQDLDDTISQFFSNGMLQYLEGSETNLKDRCEKFKDSVKPLYVDNIKGIFAMILFGIILSLIVLILENIHFNKWGK